MKIIVAFCNKQGIGFENGIPWELSNDLRRFRTLTIGKGNNAVIMGANTWKSLPKKNTPRLPKRDNLILSKSLTGNNVFKSVEELLKHCKERKYDDIWIIGGAQIYTLFMEKYMSEISEIYLTRLLTSYNCDTFFPEIPLTYKTTYRSEIMEYHCIKYIYEVLKYQKKDYL